MIALLLHAVDPSALSRAWVTETGPALAIVLLLSWYVVGLHRLWRHAGPGRGVTHASAWLFLAGALLLALALLSPLHALGSVLFSAHMTQHVLLMSVAAPLLVISRPLAAFVWALPRHARRQTARLFHQPPIRALWRTASTPLVAWSLHALTLWLWHAPQLYNATVTSGWMHAAQHTSFMAAALLFWWVLYGQLLRRRAALGVLFLFTTAVHASLLGALLTFAREPWYSAYQYSTAAWGFSALEDLQLGGLIMWVPGGFPYLWAMLLVAATWLREKPVRIEPRPIVSVALAALLLLGCGGSEIETAAHAEVGNADRGARLIRSYGCHSCHMVPGVRGADGRVGPPLGNLSRRAYIAGSVPNTAANLIRFVADPRAVRPDTGMPDVNVSEEDARDIVAYLYAISKR